MIIGIDFDGTCVTHAYPFIGDDIGAIPVLRKLIEAGHQLVLFTMRPTNQAHEAANWLKAEGIKLYGINKNPTQSDWTDSPKAYCQLYIDDAALGIPLTSNAKTAVTSHPWYVDWIEVESMLCDKGIL